MDFVIIAGIIIIAYLVSRTEYKWLKILCYIAMPIMGVLWEYISWPDIVDYNWVTRVENPFLPNLVKTFFVYMIIYYTIAIKNKLGIKLRYIFILIGSLSVVISPLGGYTHEFAWEFYHACIFDFPFIILLIVSFIISLFPTDFKRKNQKINVFFLRPQNHLAISL